MTKPNWGVLPLNVRATIIQREWNNLANVRARLLGEKLFPITIPLKAPKGHSAVEDLGHFQLFIKSWQDYAGEGTVHWEDRKYRKLLSQQVPCSFEIENFNTLVNLIGQDATKLSQHWQAMMAPLLEIDSGLYPVLVRHLSTLSELDEWKSQALKKVALQLKAGLGKDLYLRALPLTGIHSKFIESFTPILTDILDYIHDNAVTDSGGLTAWLECLDTPKGWLHVRPLCDEAKEKMGGFSALQISTPELRRHPLPARNIIIVENIQPGLSLPSLPDTIAVFGGGRNVSWTDAAWLKDKNVAYWGDIDTYGLAILSDVRKNLSDVRALMMDEDTLFLLGHFSIREPKSVEATPSHLTAQEQALFALLKANPQHVKRLEQEYCANDYILTHLKLWLK